MTRRQLERWVATHRQRLASTGVAVHFAFGPSFGGHAGSSWASFSSAVGSGRVIRAPDGSSRMDAYAYADGGCLCAERDAGSSEAHLVAMAERLKPPIVVY